MSSLHIFGSSFAEKPWGTFYKRAGLTDNIWDGVVQYDPI
jgi:hypothetical protein